MPIVAEVFRDVNGQLQPLARCNFEVPPQAGDEVDLGGRLQVIKSRHIPDATPPNEPQRMQYQVIVR
jgi:hypothetical protein